MKPFKKFIIEGNKIEGIKAIDKIVASHKATISTAIFESCVAIIAWHDKKLTGKFNMGLVNSVPDMSSKAATFYEKWLEQNKEDDEALEYMSQWINSIGGATVNLEYKITDIIFDSVDATYKKRAPSSFQVEGAGKSNTADIVLVTVGTAAKLMSMVDEIAKLSHNQQTLRVSTEKNGHIELKDENGDIQSSYYQVSLKKAVDDARVGKVTSYIVKNILKDKSKIVKPSDSAKKESIIYDVEYLDEGFLELFKKGVSFVKNLSSNVMDIISRGLDSFKKWSDGLFGKLVSTIKDNFLSIGNKRLGSDKNLKAIGSIMNSVGLYEQNDVDNFFNTLNEKADKPIPIDKSIIKELSFISSDFLGKDVLNEIIEANVKKVKKLNKLQSVNSKRVVDPFLFKGKLSDVMLDSATKKRLRKKIKDIIKSRKKVVSREDFSELLKLAMNYSANVVIGSIIDTLKNDVLQKNYQTLTDALIAMSASFEGESKFGNTALPLVIIYGGQEKQKVQVLGKRENFEKKAERNLKNAAELPNFPIAAFRLKRVSGKSYNSAAFFLLASFNGKPPEPSWIQFALTTSSGSKFSFKVEGEKYVGSSVINK